MGRSHSNAWGQVAKFFKPPLAPVMHTVFGQPEENPQSVCGQLGLEECLDRLGAIGSLAGDRPGRRGHAQLHARPGSPGRHRRRQARLLREADRRLAGRRPRNGRGRQGRQGQDVRLVQLPRVARPWPWRISWSKPGKLGEIRHVRASYLQDWAGEAVPAALAVR